MRETETEERRLGINYNIPHTLPDGTTATHSFVMDADTGECQMLFGGEPWSLAETRIRDGRVNVYVEAERDGSDVPMTNIEALTLAAMIARTVRYAEGHTQA